MTTTTKNILTVSIKQAYKLFAAAVKAGQPVLFLGQPGTGKTTIVEQVYFKLLRRMFPGGLYVLATTENNAIDLGGLYRVNADGFTERCPVDRFPFDQPVMILIDELSDALLHEQSGYYRLLHNKEIGNKPLAAGSYVCAAGNRPDDLAAANEISSAMKGRCQCYTIAPKWQETYDYGLKNGWSATLLAFLKSGNEAAGTHNGVDFIDNGFDPDLPYAGSTPRDFERVAEMEKNGTLFTDDLDLATAQIVSCIDHVAGQKYAAFRTLNLPDPAAVYADPATAPVPESAGLMFAYCAAVAQNCDGSRASVQAAFEYSKRIGRVLGCGLMQDIKLLHPDCMKTAVGAQIALEYAELKTA